MFVIADRRSNVSIKKMFYVHVLHSCNARQFVHTWWKLKAKKNLIG